MRFISEMTRSRSFASGLLVGVGDEALAGFARHAQRELQLRGKVEGQALKHEGGEEGRKTGAGCLSQGDGGSDVASEGDGAEVGMGVEIGDVGVDEAIEHGGGWEIFRFLERLQPGPQDVEIHGAAKLKDVVAGDGVEDGFPVGEEAVEATDGEPGLGGNVRGGHVVERHAGEQRAGRVENAFDGAEAAILDGMAPRGRGRVGRRIMVGWVGHEEEPGDMRAFYTARAGS